MTFTHALSTDNYGPAKFIVSAQAYQGTHTSIAAALASASSGDTIFIRPGTYTENLTLVAGVNLTAYECDSLTPNVTIIGKMTATFVGTASITNIFLQTNGDFLLAVTGSAATVIYLQNCFLNCSNNTGISYTSSSASSSVNVNYCTGNLATTGISYFASSSAGSLNISYIVFNNSGASTTASTVSAGTLNLSNGPMAVPVTISGTAGATINYITLDTAGQNVTPLTLTTTQTITCFSSIFRGGTASALVVTSPATFNGDRTTINSTNTNAVTGTGAITTGGIIFTNTSSLINTTTQSIRKTFAYSNLQLIQTQTASNSANLSFTTGISSLYGTYLFVLTNIVPVTNNTVLQLQVSIDGGSTYVSTGYQSGNNKNAYNSATLANSNSTSFFFTSPGIDNTAVAGVSGEVFLYGISSAGYKSLTGSLVLLEGGNVQMINAGGMQTTASLVNAFQWTMASGNISTGTISLFGVVQ